MPNSLSSPARREPSWLVITVLLTVALTAATYYVLSGRPEPTALVKLKETARPTSASPGAATAPLITKFSDETDVRAWLLRASKAAAMTAANGSLPAAIDAAPDAGAPDRLKLSGDRLFYASEPPAALRRANATGAVRVVKAWPTAELDLASSIDRAGTLLAADQTLIVLATDGLYAYDVSDAKKPVGTWHYALGDGQSLQSARVVGDELQVVIRAAFAGVSPCPLEPLSGGPGKAIIACAYIWHLTEPMTADTVTSLIALDPASGSVKRTAAFLGSRDGLAVSLTNSGAYVALLRPADELTLVSNFLKVNADLVPATVAASLDRVRGYDLTSAARQAELKATLDDWSATMSDSDQLAVRGRLAERLGNYWDGQRRDAERTVIVRLGPGDFAAQAVGSVPGRLTGRGAMAPDGQNLRVAVAVGADGLLAGRFGAHSLVPATDLYVLDSGLRTVGSALDVSPGKAVIDVRFLNAAAYVLNGGESDAVPVVDLSDPAKPVRRGSLPLSGYLTYLHPVSPTRLLTVSKSGSQVSLSLFDVSAGADPKLLNHYGLDEYWTDVAGTHQGFYLDPSGRYFFLPASRGGYLMSLADDQLSMITPVSGVRVTRSAAAHDLLYLAADDRLTVVNTSGWKRILEVSWARP